jgi:hypothetical protein
MLGIKCKHNLNRKNARDVLLLDECDGFAQLLYRTTVYHLLHLHPKQHN